jgi:hypothetical protein
VGSHAVRGESMSSNRLVTLRAAAVSFFEFKSLGNSNPFPTTSAWHLALNHLRHIRNDIAFHQDGKCSGELPRRAALNGRLQPQLSGTVLPEQVSVPDIPPHHLNRAMSSLIHDRALGSPAHGCAGGVSGPE